MATFKSITSANSQLAIVIPALSIGSAPVQGFAVDNAFMNEAIKLAEASRGVDGRLSAAYLPVPVTLKISLRADSPSKQIFDDLANYMFSNQEIAYVEVFLALPATGEGYTFTKGVMTSYAGTPAGKKALEDVEYEFTFESITKTATA